MISQPFFCYQRAEILDMLHRHKMLLLYKQKQLNKYA